MHVTYIVCISHDINFIFHIGNPKPTKRTKINIDVIPDPVVDPLSREEIVRDEDIAIEIDTEERITDDSESSLTPHIQVTQLLEKVKRLESESIIQKKQILKLTKQIDLLKKNNQKYRNRQFRLKYIANKK